MIAAGAVLAMVLGLLLVVGGRGMRRRRGDGSRMMPGCGPAYSITPNRSGWLASISTAGVPTNINPRRENVACVCFSASLEDRESQQCAAKLRISCGGGDLQRSSCDASFDHQVGNPLARKTANSGRPIPRSSTENACLAGANSGCRA